MPQRGGQLPEKMMAALYYGVGDVRVEETDIPEIQDGELLIKIGTALTCGTDVKTYKRGHPLLIGKTPAPFGHEYAGTVERVGAGVDDFEEGMRVVATNSAPCGTCFFCKRGRQNLCPTLKASLVNGAFAEYIRVPKQVVRWNTHRIPDNLPYRVAALTEPLACVVHGIEEANIQLGDTVAIIGAGPIGQMMIMLAKHSGASTVISSDLEYLRRQSAKKAGADITVDPNEESPVERVKEETSGYGADVVIEAVGLTETWEQAVEMTRDAGTTVLFGGTKSGTEFQVDTERLHYGELTIKGVFHLTPRHVEEALKLLESGIINSNLLITHEMSLNRITEAIEMMGAGKSMKIAIKP